MALSVNRQELDDFCPQLFRTLDNLGLLPLQLWAKPNEFEKYPRLLFGSVQRYNDVEAGFKEWESRVLRDAPYRKEERYPELEELRQWMAQHASLFTSRVNMQHLRSSLYARIFQYLYPRRVLANAYCAKHQGNPEAVKESFVAQAMPESIELVVQKLKEVYSDEWTIIIAATRTSLIANAAYYNKVLRGKEAVAPPDVTQEGKENSLQEVSNDQSN